MLSQLGVEIPRKVTICTHPFLGYFKGFENVEAVKRIFGEKTEEVLRGVKVEFAGMRGYMGVSDADGHLIVSANYLARGDPVEIYLDIIHELVHVKQFMEGKQLFDSRYEYIERPTELEAYQVAVDEARRLGMDDERICNYLKTEWMSDEDLENLAKTLHVECPHMPRERRATVRRIRQ
jgi:hypothetical protein